MIVWEGVTLGPGVKAAQMLHATYKVNGSTSETAININAQICLRDEGDPYCCNTTTIPVSL